jgi:hypothetical protein
VIVEVSERLSVRKRAAKQLDTKKRVNLKRLNDVEIKEEYQIKI